MCLWGFMCFRAQEVQSTLDDISLVSEPGDTCHQANLQACVNGHHFRVTRFHLLAHCAFCSRKIWGLGRKNFRCTNCNIYLHRDCHDIAISQWNADPAEDQEIPPVPDLLETSPTLCIEPVPCQSVCPPVPDLLESLPTQYYPSYLESLPIPYYPSVLESSPTPDYPIFLESSTTSDYPSLQEFDIIKYLGSGSYGNVLKVQHKATENVYALKVVNKQPDYGEEDTTWRLTEKRVFQVGCHYPFLVGLHYSFHTETRLFYVIDFINGRDLSFLIRSQEYLEEEAAAFYTAEVSLAVNYLHSKGIIHRDIKPENILLDEEGHVRLTDYGLCKYGLKPGDTTGTLCGTLSYTAPEMLCEDCIYNYSVDWWSLGVTAFEMMAGCLPFTKKGSTYNPYLDPKEILSYNIMEKELIYPDYFSEEAADLTMGLLKKDPEKRLGCYRQTFEDIQEHPFFRGINWELLEKRQLKPPFQPNPSDDSGDNIPGQLAPSDPDMAAEIDQSVYNDFDWVNPKWI